MCSAFFVKSILIKRHSGIVFVNFITRFYVSMKKLGFLIVIVIGIISCKTSNEYRSTTSEVNIKDQDTVRIANDDSDYEIIIIEPGFNNWLINRARPRGFYTQQFLENRNAQYVVAWNNRVLDPSNYNPRLYEMQIDYNTSIDYGYEVNYMLYYYFIYFQLNYNQQLTNLTPRI